MLFDKGFPWQLGSLPINGFSAASRVTWYVFPSIDLIVDIGWCVEPMRKISRLFLSHLHQDHSLALPTWLSWRQKESTPIIYINQSCVDDIKILLDAFAKTTKSDIKYELVGVHEGDRIQLTSNYTLEPFETDHHLPTMGFLLHQKERKLKKELRGMPSDEIRKLIQAKTEIHETTETQLLCYTADTSPALFERRPDLLRSKILLVECSYLDGYLTYHPNDNSTLGEKNVTHCHLRPLSKKLANFEGEILALTHLPRRYEGCDLYPYLLPRLPEQQRKKLVVVPYRDNRETPAIHPRREPPPLTPLQRELYYDENHWQEKERPGHFGFKKAEKLRALSDKYPGFVLAWRYQDKLLQQESALALYEDAYFEFFHSNPELVEWLVTRAADVYDTHPSNVESGLNYQEQRDNSPNHLQDIAIRRVLIRLERWFTGNELLQIRSIGSEGYALQPGIIPFHQQDQIIVPEFASDWYLPGSIESFWQSNKVVLIPA